MATRNDLCSSLYFQKTPGNCLKCDTSLVNISWTVLEIFNKNLPGWGHFALPAQILIFLNVEIGILKPLQPALPLLHLSQPWYLLSLKVGFCNLRNIDIFKCFHNITQVRPLILTCYRHLFKTWKSDFAAFAPFANLTALISLILYLDWAFANPKNCVGGGGGGQNDISSLIGYVKSDDDGT